MESFIQSLLSSEKHSLFPCIIKALTEAATIVARALYTQAGGSDPIQLQNINVDSQMVSLFILMNAILFTSSFFLFQLSLTRLRNLQK